MLAGKGYYQSHGKPSLGAALLLGEGGLWCLLAHWAGNQSQLSWSFSDCFAHHTIVSEKSATRKPKTCYGGLTKVSSPV